MWFYVPLDTKQVTPETFPQANTTKTRIHQSKEIALQHNTRLTALCPGLPGWAGTRKIKPIWILLKQETASGSGISWAIRKSAPRSRQITMPANQQSVFYKPDALPAAQPTASKHWRPVLLQRKINRKTKARFSLLLRHPAWKWSGSILKGKDKYRKGKVKK